MNIPKITVIIITYKQQSLIKRAVDSILCQKDFIYEICVSDDCSPDKTWEVLQEYETKYPGLFKLHRNETNLGIFQNLEESWKMPTGDLVYILAGDDECPMGWFEQIVRLINEKHIDYINQSVCIYGDYKCVYPNGDSFIKKNYMVEKGFDLVSLNMRKLIGNRSACYSRSILDQFFSVSDGRSYVAEWAQEIQLPLFTENVYYIPFVGNVYYTRIGVNTCFDKEILKQRENCFPYMKKSLESVGYSLRKKDNYYVELQRIKYGQIAKWSFTNMIKIPIFSVLSFDLKYGLFRVLNKRMKRVLFAGLRRIPHKKPIKIKI